jgi:hypothetical protein
VKTFSNIRNDKPERVDLRQFDRSKTVAHWRGFSKCVQPDGSIVAVSSTSDDEGFAFGPCKDGQEADRYISDFYADTWKEAGQ